MKHVVLIEIDGDPRDHPELLRMASGLYRVPTQFCEGGHTTGRRVQGFFQGKKFGWWVCSSCGKPARTAWKNTWNTPFDSVSPFGFNQLYRFLKVSPVDSPDGSHI